MKTNIKNIGLEGRMLLFLYGEVSDDGGEGKVSSREIVEALAWAETEPGCTDVLLRVNSVGGDVYPGIAIFNAIRQSKKPVTVQVDGIAASIAGIIALAAPRVEIGRYARMMLHAVSGGGFGNRQELQSLIKEIDQLEASIAGIVSERTGQSIEEVRAAYFDDGKDHWMSASEAVRLKLADAIYDEEPIPEGTDEHEIYNIFTNRLRASLQSQKQETTMNLESIKKIPRFANCATEEDVAEEAAAVVAENEQLKTRNEQLEAESEARQEEAIESTLQAAVSDGRIAEGDRETYKNLLKHDFTNAAKVLAGMKPKRRVKDEMIQTPQNSASPWEKRMEELRQHRMKK